MNCKDLAGTAGILPAGSLKQPKGWHCRGYKPHFDSPELLQFITFRLSDSMPAGLIEAWKQKLKLKPKQERETELRSRILKYIDLGHGQCFLKDDRVAELVEEALLHRDGEHYRLRAWVIRPNHVHALIEVMPGRQLHEIIHSWKSFTASMANRLLGRVGPFWYREYDDRFIRNVQHYENVVACIHHNPVKVRCCEQPHHRRWSSAWRLNGRFVEKLSEPAGRMPAVPD